MQNDEHMDTQKDEEMKAQTTRQTTRKIGLKILAMKLHEMTFP